MTKDEAKTALELIRILKEISKISKINSTFLPAFEEKSIKDGETNWLHGSFRLGGTKSGRLSSSNPNLTNIPSTGTKYAKAIKRCFKAPQGHLFVGADFNSLEDMISALTTRDPNKMRVYEKFKQYELTINGVTHRISEIDVVSYGGEQLTGEELYEKLRNR